MVAGIWLQPGLFGVAENRNLGLQLGVVEWIPRLQTFLLGCNPPRFWEVGRFEIHDNLGVKNFDNFYSFLFFILFFLLPFCTIFVVTMITAVTAVMVILIMKVSTKKTAFVSIRPTQLNLLTGMYSAINLIFFCTCI